MRTAAVALFVVAQSACGSGERPDRASVDAAGPASRPPNIATARDASIAAPDAASVAEAGPAPTMESDERVRCVASKAPSWPAVAWVGEAPLVGWHEGRSTHVARVPDGPDLILPLEVGGTGGATAAPALASGSSGPLLATIEGPGPGHRLLVRTIPSDLGASGAARVIAENVDPRYAPALTALADGFVVGWIDASRDPRRAVVQRLDRDGSVHGDPQPLSSAPAGAGGLTLATIGSRALAAWIDPHLGFSPLSVAWADRAGPFRPGRIVYTTGSVNRAALVAAAAGPGDTALLVWRHVGPLGQDYLSRVTAGPSGDAGEPAAVSRVDAYSALRAGAARIPDGWAVAWDEPLATGRSPALAVAVERLAPTGASTAAPVRLGAGSGAAIAARARTLAVAFRRSHSVCLAELE